MLSFLTLLILGGGWGCGCGRCSCSSWGGLGQLGLGSSCAVGGLGRSKGMLSGGGTTRG